MEITKEVIKELNNILISNKSKYRLQLQTTSGLYSTEGKEIDGEYVTLNVTSSGGIKDYHIMTKIFDSSNNEKDIIFTKDITRWLANGKTIKNDLVTILNFKSLLEDGRE